MKNLLLVFSLFVSSVAFCDTNRCEVCKGFGFTFVYEKCPTCKGDGLVRRFSKNGKSNLVSCPSCNSIGSRRGYVRKKVPCKKCENSRLTK